MLLVGSSGAKAGVYVGTQVLITESVHKVVLQKSIPEQIRQLMIYHY